MKTFILVATIFLANGGTIQYRMEPFLAPSMNDCLKTAHDRQGALVEMFNLLIKEVKTNSTVTSGVASCIAKDPK